jgi:hypothetical protein
MKTRAEIWISTASNQDVVSLFHVFVEEVGQVIVLSIPAIQGNIEIENRERTWESQQLLEVVTSAIA